MQTENILRLDDDIWSEWLLRNRHADDPKYAEVVRAAVERHANRVLDGAHLGPGMTLIDIGSGEGLVAFNAIDRIGPSLKVTLTDISAPMLRHAEETAVLRGVRDQCTFIESSADSLAAVADASVDVVTTRAVLAYVFDKSAALQEFYRVLMPGGRISLCEPIFQDEALHARSLRRQIEQAGTRPHDRFATLLHRWKAAQFPDTEEECAASAIANYSERDLLNLVHEAGFTEIHLELHIDVMPSPITTWHVFLGSSPHPLAPPLGAILAEQFTPDERQFFESIVRPSVESGANTVTDRIVYITAKKPSA